jgi:branched-chain amino acid transport system substrate-binding protein
MNVKSILAAGALALLASTAWAADTIKIGNIVVTAGFLKSVGEPTLTAVDIAVDEINAAGGINGQADRTHPFRYRLGSETGICWCAQAGAR